MVDWSNVTDAGSFAQVPNTTTGGWFWTAMLWMIYAIMLISMLPMGFTPAILGSAFACLMIGIIMVYMGLVSWIWVVMFAGIIVATFIWIMYEQR
jgi:cell division protein FtsW (lipid II flippase)